MDTVFWSRLQFAMTAAYHWLFVPLTLGLALVMAIMETLYVVKKDDFWRKTAQFWMKIFAVNFAVGIATGIILEYNRQNEMCISSKRNVSFHRRHRSKRNVRDSWGIYP